MTNSEIAPPKGSKIEKDAPGQCQVWSQPQLRIFEIAQITGLGFATNCDGGFGLNAIDGNAINCNP